MGLREAIQRAALSAIGGAVGNIAVSANYHVFASAVYDSSVGSMTTAFTTIAGIKVVIEDFAFEVIDGQNVRPDDRKILLARQSLGTATPSINDQVVADGETYEVVKIRRDPAEATYMLQGRRP